MNTNIARRLAGVPSRRSVGFVPTTPLSFDMKDAAATLAGRVNSGEYAELMPHQRTDLRELSMVIAGWCDRVETMEIERLPRHRVPTWLSRLTSTIRRLRQG